MQFSRERKLTHAQIYQSNQNQVELDSLICEYAPLVDRIATQIKHKCPPGIDLDDLIQSGIIGLLQARNDYTPDKGASFKTYASMKIRYAVYEGLRTHSGITRDVSQYLKKISAAINSIEKTNDSVSHTNIMNNLGVSQQQYTRMCSEIKAHKTVSLEGLDNENALTVDGEDGPFSSTLRSELQLNVKNAIQELPKREQLILMLYYNEFLSFKEIAQILQLTEARVSQLHHQLLNKLKRLLNGMEDIFEE